MGCNACGFQEPEVTIQFPENEIGNEKGKKNSKDTIKQSYNDFISKFNKNLEFFGEYISKQDFNSKIPKKIKDYMEKNPLEIKQQYSKNTNIYETEPIEFKNGNIYQGNWNKDFKLEGPGKYYLKEDNVFAEGNWDNGELIYARVFLPNGDIYEGQIKDSTFNGKGKLESYNKDIYEGDFVNGEKTGEGKIIFSDGTIYEGSLDKGEFRGKGKMIWKNGYEYNGEFNGQILSGKGKLSSSQGDFYEGDFENNLFHGKGKYFFSKSGNEYKGDFQYGIRKGKGIYSALNQYIYDGNWDDNLPCGIGKLTNWNKTSILKCTWRFGKIAEEPIFEKGSEKDFESINKNIEPEEMKLDTKGLPHLDLFDNDSTQYKIDSFPSFLQD